LLFFSLCTFFLFLFQTPVSLAAQTQYSAEGLTFSQLLKAGGWVMAVIIVISVVMLALGIFLLDLVTTEPISSY